MRKATLGEFEHLVLLAALSLGNEAYAPGIARKLEEDAGREMSRGTLYAALDRLVDRGFLVWEVEPSSSRRAGNRKRRFTVTQAGIQALAESRNVLLGLWADVAHLLEGGGR